MVVALCPHEGQKALSFASSFPQLGQNGILGVLEKWFSPFWKIYFFKERGAAIDKWKRECCFAVSASAAAQQPFGLDTHSFVSSSKTTYFMRYAHGGFCRPLSPKGSRVHPYSHSNTKKPSKSWAFCIRAGKGNTQHRSLALRADASSYGLEACASSAEIFQLCSLRSHMKNFSRTLFSAPSPFLSRRKKKENHPNGWFSFFEREKGLGPSTPTLARSCSTN